MYPFGISRRTVYSSDLLGSPCNTAIRAPGRRTAGAGPHLSAGAFGADEAGRVRVGLLAACAVAGPGARSAAATRIVRRSIRDLLTRASSRAGALRGGASSVDGAGGAGDGGRAARSRGVASS